MEPRKRIAVELIVLLSGYGFLFAVIEFPSVRTTVPRSVWTPIWVVMAATFLLLVTEILYYVRYRVDWLSDPM